jgi:murein DD-endopeptidase MepM/ murein hydrolase activator NlpD
MSGRAIALTGMALLVSVAVYATRAMRRNGVQAMPAPDTAWSVRADTLGDGETLSELLDRGGLRGAAAVAALRAAPGLDERRVPAGLPVVLRTRRGDSLPSEVSFTLAVDHSVVVRRIDSAWTGSDVRIPWATDTVIVSGVIHSNLYVALDTGPATILPKGARVELAWSMADIYEYRVDMSRDLQDGDIFRVAFERSTLQRAGDAAGPVRIGRILAASFRLSGSTMEAYRFTSAKAPGDFFDQAGRSMRANFLRAPLEFRRISSTFGSRKHPILGTWRQHKGTDYAAQPGTPVRAIGDGVVLRAGRSGGYGNLIEVRHPNGFISRYGHLRGFAKGVSSGARVTIGSTIGYVGSTGLATGPHLHFEILVNGVQRDPRSALQRTGGAAVPSGERPAFDSLRTTMAALLARPEGALRPATP